MTAPNADRTLALTPAQLLLHGLPMLDVEAQGAGRLVDAAQR